VVDTTTFQLISKTRPDIMKILMDRIKERDEVRRWNSNRQSREIFKLDQLLARKNNQMEDDDNSFMRNSPFPFRVIIFGIILVFVYYMLITRLPPAQKGWIPMANIGVMSIAFIFVMRSLTRE
jgi:uncharacterized membrane protein (DUF106 family)